MGLNLIEVLRHQNGVVLLDELRNVWFVEIGYDEMPIVHKVGHLSIETDPSRLKAMAVDLVARNVA